MENNEVELLKQELNSYKQYNNDLCKSLVDSVKDLDARLKTIEVTKEKTDYQYEQIMKSLTNLTEVTIPGLASQINELKNKPIKRYEQAISGILGSIFGAIGGVITGIFLKK